MASKEERNKKEDKKAAKMSLKEKRLAKEAKRKSKEHDC